MSLNGKHIVVTGGAGGIGSLLCQELLEQRAKVTVVDRGESLPFDAAFVRGDLSHWKGWQRLPSTSNPNRWIFWLTLPAFSISGHAKTNHPDRRRC